MVFLLTFTEVTGKMKMIKKGKVLSMKKRENNPRVEARKKKSQNTIIDKKIKREDNQKKERRTPSR